MNREVLDKIIYRAYLDARKNERNTLLQLQFEINLEKNLRNLREALYNRTYKPSPPICFLIFSPSVREIFAPVFVDRIVSHVLFNILYPLFDPLFINDSYSCRKGKGTFYGIERFEHNLRSCTNNFTKTAYCLSIDISGYFMNINQSILEKLIIKVLDKNKDKIDYSFTVWLTNLIIKKNTAKNCLRLGDKSLWKLLPSYKSMFNAPEGIGLHIGDVTSLLFSNIYLNQSDLFAKRNLKCKYYSRYVDDIRIFSQNKKELLLIMNILTKYLEKNLGLKVNCKKTKFTNCNKPLRFLGAVIIKNRRYINSDSAKRFISKVSSINKRNVETSELSLNSYLGYLSHFRTDILISKTIDKFGINLMFDFDLNYKKVRRK